MTTNKYLWDSSQWKELGQLLKNRAFPKANLVTGAPCRPVWQELGMQAWNCGGWSEGCRSSVDESW